MVIAIVGPMASGKNYLSSQYEKQGWKTIDADILVHDAIDFAKDKILSTFIPYANKHNLKIQKSDGSIDRRELGRLLFSIPELLTIQESIVYPIITKKIEDIINENENVVINATVLYKTPELINLCSKIYFVKASFLKRLIRARKRDKLPFLQILKRFWAQRNIYQEYKKTGVEIVKINNN